MVVGVAVSAHGSDQPALEPMVEPIATRYARLPGDYLVDGGFVALERIERLSEQGVTFYHRRRPRATGAIPRRRSIPTAQG